MNNHISLYAAALASLMFIGAGCQPTQVAGTQTASPPAAVAPSVQPQAPQQAQTPEQPSTAASSTATILISAEDTTKYCNGADMDSDGYRKTITQEKTIILPHTGQTQEELVKAIVLFATSGMCRDALAQLDFKVTDGTVHIPPIEGWAGVSIAMCSCRPQVEVNLLRLPGIKQVVWD